MALYRGRPPTAPAPTSQSDDPEPGSWLRFDTDHLHLTGVAGRGRAVCADRSGETFAVSPTSVAALRRARSDGRADGRALAVLAALSALGREPQSGDFPGVWVRRLIRRTVG